MPTSINRSKVKTYLISLLVPLVLGGIVGFLTAGSMDYASLNKPVLAPAAAVFPIVWTILYLLMGISHGMLKANGLSTADTESVYYVQLIVNLLWPVLFFSLRWRLAALLWIILLDALVIIMTVRFYQKRAAAGLLQLPYIVWVLFATYLNLSLYLLNR